jgi:hypothetical protein
MLIRERERERVAWNLEDFRVLPWAFVRAHAAAFAVASAAEKLGQFAVAEEINKAGEPSLVCS